MRAPTRLCALLLALAALPAWGGGKANPYRLAVDPAEYRLQVPGAKARGAAGRPGKPGYAEMIERHARARGLDPALVHAVVQAESAYRPEAVSPKGAVGLMQVMPDTGRRFGVHDLEDPEANVRAGTAYLDHLLDLFSDLSLALAAYNAGEGAVLRYGRRIPPYPETQAYVQGILRNYGPAKAAPSRGAAPRQTYLPGTRLEGRNLSAYRLRKDPWRDPSG